MKKVVACFLVFSIIFTSVDSKNERHGNEGVSPVINELEKIKKEGITSKEIEHFIEFLQEKYGESNVYINMMCKVVGIGAGLLFPPFIPAAPVLIAALGILLDTTGLMGHWTHVVHIAIFIPFIGLPAYFAPPALFFIAGFAGIVIGIAIFK